MKMSLGVVVSVCVVMVACKASDDPPKVPLGAATASAEAPAGATGLSQAAKDLLEAGNTAYRAKQFDVAIAKYREAAVEAPTNAAPWYGVYMAASATKNTALADSANAHVKALSSDTAALNAHADAAAGRGALPEGHPGSGSALPPGHPSADAQLPAGHPAPVKKP